MYVNQSNASKIAIAAIAEVEYYSAIWKKCIMNLSSEEDAKAALLTFEHDLKEYTIVTDSSEIKKKAARLITKHWKNGLRSLDAIQLASAITIESKDSFFVSSDKLLCEVASLEGFNVEVFM